MYDYPAHPPALKSMINLLRQLLPTLAISQDVPSAYPTKFIAVDRVAGDEIAHGTIMVSMFVFQCYAPTSGDAESLAESVLQVLKNAQFTVHGGVQFRNFDLVAGPQDFPDPKVPSHRRWQFTGTFAIK